MFCLLHVFVVSYETLINLRFTARTPLHLFLQSIAHLKQSLKSKEAAMAEMSRASAKATEEVSKAASSPPVSKTKKVSDSPSPTRPMKSGTLSGKTPGGSAKPAPSTSMKNRAALPGAQSASPNNRGGL